MKNRNKKVWLVALVLSIGLLLTGCERKATQFSRAYEYYQNEQYEEALEIFDTLENFRGSADLADECREKLGR